MLLGGLRVGELCKLRWRAVDLARGLVRVEDGKTDASRRAVDLSPDMLDELKAHKAGSQYAEPDDLVFSTRRGTPRDRGHVRTRVLQRAIARANAKLAEAGLGRYRRASPTTPAAGPSPHCSTRPGASPAYVMSQMGHTSAALALEVYAKKMERQRDTGARMDALIRAADWAQTGTNRAVEPEALPSLETQEAAERPLSSRDGRIRTAGLLLPKQAR